MAAYAYTPTIHQKTHKPLLGFPGMKLISGTLNITNYNGTTPAAIVEITNHFKGAYVVILTMIGPGAVLDMPSWDSIAGTVRFTVNSTGAQLADNISPGVVSFIAVGN